MGIEQLRAIKEAAGKPKEKKKYTIPKVSEKKKKQIAEGKQSANSGELQRWFEERRAEMTGFCKNCNKPSCKNDDNYFKFSICHILPKSTVKSVATNEFNWIELCYFHNSCHPQMDNGMLDMTEMACWNEIVEKFQKMYPAIEKKERRRIPDVLFNYIEVDL